MPKTYLWLLIVAIIAFLSFPLRAQQEGVIKVIESKDASGEVVKSLGVATRHASGPSGESLATVLPASPCKAVTSDGKGKKNYVSKFTTPCNIEDSTMYEVTNSSGTVVNVQQALSVNSTKTGNVPTLIGGCSGTYDFASIAFGTTDTCGSFSLAGGVFSGRSMTLLNVPSGGEISVNVGLSKIVSFNDKAANFYNNQFDIWPSGGAWTSGNFQADGTLVGGGLQVGGGPFTVDSSGNVNIAGNLSVHGQKNFQIDHPLDPGDKYLYHSAVESSEMMNIYTGNVITNIRGDATVQLPAWFQALNGDFRYQLTVIGQFAQAIVASKIQDSKFSIKTDKPNVEVSWQVTGVRQDAYAKAHPLVVEQDKPASERGYYLHPELFGAPESKGVAYAHSHQLSKVVSAGSE